MNRCKVQQDKQQMSGDPWKLLMGGFAKGKMQQAKQNMSGAARETIDEWCCKGSYR